jgi:hypothetical protein
MSIFALLTMASVSLASSPYPEALANDAGAPCIPQCTVCHATNSGGSGTVVMDFGKALMDRGLTGGSNTTLLASSLELLLSDAVDSDGDGTSDVDELTAGTDPNLGGVDICGVDTISPQYGCFASAQVAPAAGRWGWLAAVGMALIALRARRN